MCQCVHVLTLLYPYWNLVNCSCVRVFMIVCTLSVSDTVCSVYVNARSASCYRALDAIVIISFFLFFKPSYNHWTRYSLWSLKPRWTHKNTCASTQNSSKYYISAELTVYIIRMYMYKYNIDRRTHTNARAPIVRQYVHACMIVADSP